MILSELISHPIDFLKFLLAPAQRGRCRINGNSIPARTLQYCEQTESDKLVCIVSSVSPEHVLRHEHGTCRGQRFRMNPVHLGTDATENGAAV